MKPIFFYIKPEKGIFKIPKLDKWIEKYIEVIIIFSL